jgi:iduronate 2-sulfatase
MKEITQILLIVSLLGFTVYGQESPSSFAPAKNVLFIVSDDLNDVLGCYGGPALTPHLDKLAARGTLFEHAYCQVPWCSPSRSSFLTGRKPDVVKVHILPTAANPQSPHFRDAVPHTVTLPQLYRRNSALSARIGKLYHYGVPDEIGTGGFDDRFSWDFAVNPRGLDREVHSDITTLVPGKFGGTLSWLSIESEDEDHTDGIVATESIEMLERFAKRKERFFLGTGFFRPHTPFVAPKKWFDLYPLNEIELPDLSESDQTRTPARAYKHYATKQQAGMTDSQRREVIQAYLATVSFLDAQVGRVIEALNRLDLSDDTIIVFTSDHGYLLGDHGLWQKNILFERALRVPLIIAGADIPAGQRAAGPVGLIDLYPTLASLTGLPAPEYLDGKDLSPMLRDPGAKVNEAVFSQYQDGYSVRTSRWRYTEWNQGKDAATLFDMLNDPAETNNLADDPEKNTVLQAMKSLLVDYR